MIAIGYSRISTVEQSHHSLENQRRQITEFCIKNNIELLEIFEDNGESSYTFDRPDFKKLESFIKKTKGITHLVISDYDRFSRNLAEALTKIKQLQDKYSIKVQATTETLEIDNSDPNSYMMRAFKLMMAESELLNIRKRTKAGIVQAAMSGYCTNAAPYGYKNVRTTDNKGTLEIVPEKAELVKQIYKLHGQWLAPENIRKLLKPKGYTQKGNSQIQGILKNATYAGMIKVPTYQNRPEYWTKGKHQSIITENEYWAAQGQAKQTSIQNSDEVPMRGLLRCWCGKIMTAGNSKGRSKYYWYYLCSEHRKNLPAKKLHDKFEDLLDALTFSADDVDWFKENMSYKIAAYLQDKGNEITAFKKELSTLKRTIETTEERYLSNQNINPETFNKKILELKTRKIFLENEIKLKSNSNNDYIQQMQFILLKFLNLRNAYNAMDATKKRLFIKTIFGNNLRYTNETYRTTFLHPFFCNNELIVKEKGLLIKDSPVVNLVQNSISAPERS